MNNLKYVSLTSLLLAGFLAFSSSAYAHGAKNLGNFNITADRGGGGNGIGKGAGNEVSKEVSKEGGNGGLVVTSVAEPETYLMMLSGLGLLGFSARRRTNDQV